MVCRHDAKNYIINTFEEERKVKEEV